MVHTLMMVGLLALALAFYVRGARLRETRSRMEPDQFWSGVVRTHWCYVFFYPFLGDQWEKDGKPDLL